MGMLKEFLKNIAEEANGFRLGEPWHPTSGSIVAILPIMREVRQERGYITLSEAGDMVSIEDTGSIYEAVVTSNAEKPVFIPAGQMLEGETQARVVAQGMIISPGEVRIIPVFCIHQSHPIVERAPLRPGKAAPGSIERSLYTDRRARGSTRQNKIWDRDRRYGEEVSPTDQADDLSAAHSRRIEAMRKVLSQLPETPNQVGLAIMVPIGVGSLECFDLPDSWRGMGKSLIEKEVEILGQTMADFESVFEYKPQKARSILRTFLRREFVVEPIISGHNWETIGISTRNYAGEATIMDSNIIHISLGRKGH